MPLGKPKLYASVYHPHVLYYGSPTLLCGLNFLYFHLVRVQVGEALFIVVFIGASV